MTDTATTRRRRARPRQVRVTMYNMGFGDCFLLTFSYGADGDRHVLIDCGTTSERKPHTSRVVDRIARDCNGHLDAVVVTHRHQDHLSAFGLQGVGDKLAGLNPDVVIQPWTEHPDAAKGAIEAPSVFTPAAAHHMLGLDAACRFAQHLAENTDRLLAAASPQTRRYLRRLAKLNIPNKAAIRCLTKMDARHAYVHAGGPSGLEDLLPGVKVRVLGPPTLRQSEKIRRQRSWDADEFWRLHASLGAAAAGNPPAARARSALFPKARTDPVARAPSQVRWAIRKFDTAQLHNARRIVRALDDAMNNTSVVLLFEVAGRAMLFSGDAQLENWQYALASKSTKRRLRRTTLYKVGHHGSTNATPKSLWALLWRQRRRPGGLISLLSTEKGHHHNVPRKSLVEALAAETACHCTQGWRKLSETYDLL